MFGSILMIFTGFGWAKPVPVTTRYFKNVKKGMILTALAGPAANIILSLLSLILYKLWCFFLYPLLAVSFTTANAIAQILSIMCLLNINLAVFNLIPIPPLDGSRIVTAVLPASMSVTSSLRCSSSCSWAGWTAPLPSCAAPSFIFWIPLRHFWDKDRQRWKNSPLR